MFELIRRWPSQWRRPSTQGDPCALTSPLHQDVRRALACYSADDYERHISPIFEQLKIEFKLAGLSDEAKEVAIERLLCAVCLAGRRRQRTRLPNGRPGTDYRKYHQAYTYALVAAMVVECWLSSQTGQESTPEEGARRLLTQEKLSELKSEAIVWEDWRGYFSDKDGGGLYTLAHASDKRPPPAAGSLTTMVDKGDTESAQEDKADKSHLAGWAFVDALKSCLDDGSLSLNEPGDLVQVDAQGRVFIRLEAFEAIVQLQELSIDPKKLENQFTRLRLHRRDHEGRALYRGRSRPGESWCRGYVVEDMTRLWPGELPRGSFRIKGLNPAPPKEKGR